MARVFARCLRRSGVNLGLPALCLSLLALLLDQCTMVGQSLFGVLGRRDDAQIGPAFVQFRLGTAGAIAENQRAVSVHAAVNLGLSDAAKNQEQQ